MLFAASVWWVQITSCGHETKTGRQRTEIEFICVRMLTSCLSLSVSVNSLFICADSSDSAAVTNTHAHACIHTRTYSTHRLEEYIIQGCLNDLLTTSGSKPLQLTVFGVYKCILCQIESFVYSFMSDDGNNYVDKGWILHFKPYQSYTSHASWAEEATSQMLSWG